MSDIATAAAKSPRYRVNLKETAKGMVQIDCTAECEDSQGAVDAALALLSDTRRELISQGRQVVGE